MAFNVVQHGSGTITVNTVGDANAAFFTVSPVITGNFFWLIFTATGVWIGPGGGRGSFTLSDNQNNSWKFLAPAGPVNQYINIFYTESIVGGPIQIQLTGLLDSADDLLWQGSLTYQYFEASGIVSSNALDATNSYLFPSGPSVGTLTLPITTNFSNEIIIAYAVGNTAPPNPPSVIPGFESAVVDSANILGNFATLLLESQVASTPGTYNSTCSWSGSSGGAASMIFMASFILGTGAGSGSYQHIVTKKATFPVISAQGFVFTSSWGDDFTLGGGQQEDSGLLPPATYSIVETPVVGWTTVVNVDPSSLILSSNETINVIYNNSLPSPGNIITRKITNPGTSDQVFTFTPSWNGPFTLTTGQSNDSGPLDTGSYSIVETPVFGWTTTTSRDPHNIIIDGSGATVEIIFTNTLAILLGNSLVGDFTEGITHQAIKWDIWTYINDCRLLSAPSGQLTNIVSILPSGKVIKLDSNQTVDYIDGTSVSPIYNYSITAGFDDEEDALNFLYAIVMRVIGEGLLHVSVMQMDDEFATNPSNQIDCPPVTLQLTPGKVVQVTPKFEGEKYYIKFACQIPIEGSTADIAAWFTLSRFILYSTMMYMERPQ